MAVSSERGEERQPASSAAGRLWLQRLYYPAVIAGALALCWVLMANGASTAWAPYVAVAAAGLAVVAGERLMPYRPEWRPGRADLLDDAAFMLAVQVGLPLALGWAVVWLTQAALSGAGLTLQVWPGHWPLWAQVALKLAAGDFLRYWLHRWSHQHGWLWRLHAVHHHPPKLYALNVFRFHPADKFLQFLLDTFPFILLSIGPEALAFYFVLYASSGFFQHSNCDLRLGWGNYLVSGPEVHRWHHSQAPEESNHNYAHTLIVWDLLFGTYYRPDGRSVGRLGLLDPGYPTRFLGQMAAPFRRSGSAPADDGAG